MDNANQTMSHLHHLGLQAWLQIDHDYATMHKANQTHVHLHYLQAWLQLHNDYT